MGYPPTLGNLHIFEIYFMDIHGIFYWDLVGIYNGMYLVYLDLLKMIFLPLDYSLLGESATQEYVSVLFGLRQIHLVI
jgi:hypothetical protein